MPTGGPMYYVICGLLFVAAIALFFIVRRRQDQE
jgi:hypothetical protein